MSIRAQCVAAALAMCTFMMTACGGGGGGGSDKPDPPATVLSQPGDVLVTAGLPASFNVSSAGTAAIQWQRLTSGAWVDIPGATSEVYTLPNAQASDDSANFRAKLTPIDGGPVLLTSPVSLRVVKQPVTPSVIVNPVDQTLNSGLGATFTVTATGTSLTYRWQRRGSGDTSFTDIPGATGSTLVLASLSNGDNNAAYRAVISNALSSVTSVPARLTVRPSLAVPVFTQSPSNVPAVAGQPASFTVTLTGTPAPTLVWQSSTDGVTWADIGGQTSSTLTLPTVSVGISGTQYRAVATNPTGTVFSAPGILTVRGSPVAPVIETQPSDLTVGAGSIARFAVEASGTPAPALQWQVSLDGGVTFTNITGATAAELSLPAVTMADSGKKLRALAHSSAGSITSDSVTLSVRAGPQITRQPQPQAWRPGLPLPNISVEALGSGLSYQWQASASPSSGFHDISGATASVLTTFTPPNQDCWIRVVIRNAAGDATTSEPARLTRLKWVYQSPLPTGDTMLALEWLSDTIVVGVGEQGSVIRSADAGQTWTAIREGSGQVIRDVAFGSSSVGVAVGAEGGKGLVLRTTDGGQHWEQVPGVSSQELVAVAFYDSDTILVVGKQGVLLRSLDGGRNWAPVGTGATANWIDMAFRNGLGIAVNQDGHIFRSINGGAQWERTFMPPYGTMRYDQAIAFASDSTVVVSNQLGVTRSTDGGRTWQDLSNGGSWSGGTSMAFANANQGVHLPDTAPFSAYATNDGGATWSQYTSWPREFNGTAIAFRGDIGIAATGGNGSLLRTTDRGQTWTVITDKIESIQGASFGTSTVGVVISHKNIYRTIDAGAHWTTVGASLSPQGIGDSWRRVAFLDATTVIAMDSTGRIVRSTDGGVNWSVFSTVSIPSPYMLGFMAFSSPNLGWLVVNSALKRTTDGGLTWQDVPGAYNCLHNLMSPSSTKVVVLTCSGSIQHSIDGGQTWQWLYDEVDSTYANRSVAFANDQVGVAVGRYGRIRRTTNGGATWTAIAPPPALTSEHLDNVWFESPSIGYLISEQSGIYRTADGGLTWALDNGRNRAKISMGIGTSNHTSIGLSAGGLVMLRTEQD